MAIISGHGARTRSATAASCSSAASSTRTRSATDSKAASRDCLGSSSAPRAAPIRQPTMTDTRAGSASITERIRPVEAGAPVVAIHFLDRTAFFVLGEESLMRAPPGGAPQRVTAHAGGILASAADEKRVLTAGDDGKVVATSA